MKTLFLEAAQIEFDQAVDYYIEHAGPKLAEDFLNAVQKARQHLSEYPESGAPVSKNMRVLHLQRFPYAVVYRITQDAIILLAVAHQRRRPLYWRKRYDC